MSAALDAMVKAMEGEIERQVNVQIADHEAGKFNAGFAHFSGRGIFPETQINAAIDLEKVARAGLAAVGLWPLDVVMTAVGPRRSRPDGLLVDD